MRAIFATMMLCVCAAAHAEIASWYNEDQWTASGERFNPHALTAAHRTLPFGTRLRVCRSFSPVPPARNRSLASVATRARSNRVERPCVVVRINDRGPAAWTHRDIDLSEAAARELGLIGAGVGAVQIKVVH